MTNSRRSLLALAVIPMLLVLTACGPGSPTPGASGGGSSPSPSATPTDDGPTAEPEEAREVSIAVNSSLVGVYAVDDGEHIASVNFSETDHAAAAARLAAAIGEEPVITTTAGTGSGCDADQTIYDFGGFLLRSPGFVGSIGVIEAQVNGAMTTGGVPIFTLGGAQVGTARADFDALAGPVVDLGSTGSSAWVGFDQSNPGVAEYDAIGSIARFDSGVLAQVNAPYFFYGDC